MSAPLFGRVGGWSERAVTSLTRSIYASPWLYLLGTLLLTLFLGFSLAIG